MPDTLATKTPDYRRMVLTCYVLQSAMVTPQQREQALALLKDKAWVPTPENCPVKWAKVEAWHDGLPQARIRFASATLHEV